MASASAPVSRFPVWVPVLTFLRDGPWQGSISQTNTSLPKLLLVIWCFCCYYCCLLIPSNRTGAHASLGLYTNVIFFLVRTASVELRKPLILFSERKKKNFFLGLSEEAICLFVVFMTQWGTHGPMSSKNYLTVFVGAHQKAKRSGEQVIIRAMALKSTDYGFLPTGEV